MRYLAGILILFALLVGITSPSTLADTNQYAQQILNHRAGQADPFWEFGHLIWRPWGSLGEGVLGTAFAARFGDTPFQAIIRHLIVSSLVLSLLTLPFLFSLFRRVSSDGIAAAVTFCFVASNAFLGYTLTGAPYNPGFFFLTFAAWCAVRATESSSKSVAWAVLAGVSFTIMSSLWFLYAFSGLGILALFYFSPLGTDRPAPPGRGIRLCLVFLASLAACFTAICFWAAYNEGIRSPGGFLAWAGNAGHGWRQTLNAVRFVTGFPRGFFEFGDDTILLKRYLFKDPFNQPGLGELLGLLALRLGLVYLAMMALLYLLWRRQNRTLLWIVAAGSLPIILFAVLLFEPSSPERYLPAYPFLFLGIAGALASAPSSWWRYPVWAFLLAMPLLNLVTLGQIQRSGRDGVVARQRNLDAAIPPGKGRVFVITLRDNLHFLFGLLPLDETLARRHYVTNDIALLASEASPKWRQIFAERARGAWDRGEEVWVSKRVFAARPEAGWLWVEGDDKNIYWKDLGEFFSGFTYGDETPGDGFRHLERNPENEGRLAGLLGK